MLERLMQPAVLLIVLGAVCVYGSAKLAGWILKGRPNGEIILKGIGCALAVIGAVWLFTA